MVQVKRIMNRFLIIGLFFSSAVTPYAQAQQPNTAKLKADAQTVVNIIRGDRAKTQAYCQINSLGAEIDQVAQARDEQKADALTKKINDLERQVGIPRLVRRTEQRRPKLERFSGYPVDVRYARRILSALTEKQPVSFTT
jgi:hypothetical protein